MLREGGPPVALARVAVLHRGLVWLPDKADVPGDTWVFKRNVVGLNTTVVSRRTGEPIAHQHFRTLAIVRGPTLRWRPRNLHGDPPGYVRDDGHEVATFHGSAVQVMSGQPHVDLVCALLGCRRVLSIQSANLPPSGV